MELGFLAANLGRAFPFIKGTVGLPITGPVTLANLPNATIADCGFVAGVESGFDPSVHGVRLSKIRRASDVFYFDFVSDAPAMFDEVLTFSRDVSASRFTYESESESVSDSSGTSDSEGCREPLWTGCLITGDLAELDLLLAGDGEIGGDVAVALVEPALIQSLDKAFAASLNLANDDRTRVTAPEGCPDPSWPFETGGVFVRARCLQDEIVFEPGYNSGILQNSLENSITFLAAVGAGQGRPCGPIERFDGETAPDGSSLLEGGPSCFEAVRTVNGVSGPMLQLLRGNGVAIEADPDNHKIRINVNMDGLAVCFDSISHVSDSLSL